MVLAESFLASYFVEILGGWVRRHDLGLVAAPDGLFRLWPGRVRFPDVAFVSWA